METIPKLFPRVPYFPPGWGREEVATVWRHLLHGFSDDPDGFAHFKEQLASVFPTKKMTFFNSGKAAIFSLLKQWNVGPGDEVIIPAFICESVYFPILMCGAVPVEADVDPEDLNISIPSVIKKISAKTKAILVAHLYGNPANIVPLLEVGKNRGIKILDDAAPSFGASLNGQPVGSFGNGGAISIGPGKSTSGVRGAICLSNDQIPGSTERESGIRLLQIYLKFLLTRQYRKAAYPLVRLHHWWAGLNKRKDGIEMDTRFTISQMAAIDAAIGSLQVKAGEL